MSDELTCATFEPHLNTEFRLTQEGSQAIGLELIVAEELGSEATQPSETGRRAFALVFRGPAEVALPQMTYTVEHEKAGTQQLFLVPIQPDQEGPLYEAVFN